MSNIKSLADQLKSRLEEQKGLSGRTFPAELDEEKTDANDRKAKKPAVDTKGLRSFLSWRILIWMGRRKS